MRPKGAQPLDPHKLEALAKQGLSIPEMSQALSAPIKKIKWWLGKYNIQVIQRHGPRPDNRPRQCRFCGETDPAKFATNRKLTYSICKACRSQKYTLLLRKKRAEAIEWAGGKCMRCGYGGCVGALHFHHRDPLTKDPEWKQLRKKSLDTIKLELAKCDLICANCHAEAHWKEAEELPSRPHGNTKTWETNGDADEDPSD